MEYEKELELVKRIVVDAYGAVCDQPDAIEQSLKAEIEDYIKSSIREAFPEDRILCKAQGFESFRKKRGRIWTIDPMDKRNRIDPIEEPDDMPHGLPIFGIQCALLADRSPVVAAIYHPNTGELFWTSEDGAFCNGAPIHASDQRPVEEAVVSIANFSHNKPHGRDAIFMAVRERRTFKRKKDKVAKMIRLGASCYDFAHVACGKMDGAVAEAKNACSLAPGLLLCEKAECFVSNLEGKPYEFGHFGVMACANEEVWELLKDGFSTKGL